MLQPERIKTDFPIFKHHPDLVYLDSAATAQKPEVVLEAMHTYYEEYAANVSRGLYPLAEMTTAAVVQSREKIAAFLGHDPDTTLFVASATHGINLIATGLREQIHKGENIVVTYLEHHSNFLPWKELSQKTGADFRIAQSSEEGALTVLDIVECIDNKTKILAFSAVSNVSGLINPVTEIITAVRKKNPNTLILVDACQAIGHIPISLHDWDTDYLVFSGHKVFGPTGIGVLAGKRKSLELLGAVNSGGGTVLDPLVSPVTYKQLPDSLEGGTPNIAGIIGLGAAIDYVQTIGIESIHQHEQKLLEILNKKLLAHFGESIHILGTEQKDRAGILSFVLRGIHPHDLAHLLGEEAICIRAGEHCARPLHKALGINASARVSVSIYNTETDIDRLIDSIKRAKKLFSV